MNRKCQYCTESISMQSTQQCCVHRGVDIEKISKLIYLHSNLRQPLSGFSVEDLQYFPLQYLINCADRFDLLNVWMYLPNSYRMCEHLQLKLPCYKHHNLPTQREHVDGPPPSIKNCSGCIKRK